MPSIRQDKRNKLGQKKKKKSKEKKNPLDLVHRFQLGISGGGSAGGTRENTPNPVGSQWLNKERMHDTEGEPNHGGALAHRES